MIELIESNRKEMKEVLSNEKTIWKFERDADSGDTVQLLDYEEYDVEINLKGSNLYIYTNNVPKTFGNRHNSAFISTGDFKKLFSHMEILGVELDISHADSAYYSSSLNRIYLQFSSIQNVLSKADWTTFNNKIKLYYRDTKSIKRTGRRLIKELNHENNR